MPVIYATKLKQYYTGEGWSPEPQQAKTYATDDVADKVARSFGMQEVEIQPDPTKDDDDATPPGVHEAGHGGGNE